MVYAPGRQRKLALANQKGRFPGPAEMVALATISAHVVAKATIFFLRQAMAMRLAQSFSNESMRHRAQSLVTESGIMRGPQI